MQSDASSAFLQLGSPRPPPMPTVTGHPPHRTGYAVQKRFNRPATAPSADDLLLLPSLPSRHSDGPHIVLADVPDDILPDDKSVNPMPARHDWPTFIAAYAAGRWDPHRTPNPPTSPPDFVPTPLELHSVSLLDNSQHIPVISLGIARNSTGSIKSRTAMALHLPIPAHRTRNLLSASLPNHPTADQPPPSPSVPHADVQTTVATMRWAAARVDISPLALPSPEHELTDPMRGVTATIPGSHSRDSSLGSDYLITPGESRRLRLPSFWRGTTDVEIAKLVTIEGSPPEQADNTPKSSAVLGDGVLVDIPPPSPTLRPISASILVHPHANSAVQPTDYFGDAILPPPEISRSDNKPREPTSAPATSTQVVLQPHSDDDSTLLQPKRISLTRQSSSPLPVSTSPEANTGTCSRLLGGRVLGIAKEKTCSKAGWVSRFENCFSNLGYLLPPSPPDELERRRALYKFNIWHTGADQNFDRIVHLVKLVFNTKCVVMSLIDEHEQWFKSEWGCKTTSIPRDYSFCGHTILQRGDEPMVVLDTLTDWRFAHNPIAVGSPSVRFYAGAPLRSQEGYNIGTLAVMDDQPRDEFSPRQRHTLKEFAAVAMREMELWRDKIQLRIRERIQLSMEQFSRECLEVESEVNEHNGRPDINLGSSMDKVYDRAAKLVMRTLDVEGVLVMDVSQCEVIESMSEGGVSITMHHGEPGMDMTRRQLTTEEGRNLTMFFEKFPEGRISEGIIPQSFKPFLPTRIQYALTVPIFNIDKRPFALLCAYNATSQAQRFLEGHELSYLRAIGVIILSAVLKRRMILADKAKGLFISNISHELRTPLHGILAAAELLSESPLNPSQASFLQTVQACGTSLVETVNHVLDFTKLSGSGKAGGVEHVIVPTPVDLMQLVEDAVDGCWIGYRARSAVTGGDSGIGSVYSPPKDDKGSPVASARKKYVETVVDIGYGPQSWTLKCEKGGIRRVLMNLFGNSLKFTSDGYIHVVLRQLQQSEDDPKKVKVELSVFDTGKGISQEFLKNQLFHPFSQENPLQTGTGLGLAIVSSIVTSENVGGKVDVWSEEGVGTEIKVIFSAEVPEDSVNGLSGEMQPFKAEDRETLPTIALVGFSERYRGTELLKNTFCTYLTTWWGFQIVDGGDIVLLNEETRPVVLATEARDVSRPFIILSSARGNPTIMSIASDHERIGGFCRILYKPSGPSRLRALLKLGVHALTISKSRSKVSSLASNFEFPIPFLLDERRSSHSSVFRRNSDEIHMKRTRPGLSPRSSTSVAMPSSFKLASVVGHLSDSLDSDSLVPTISVGTGGTLLKASISSITPERRFRVLVVEDNSILRNLLLKWLSNKGYDLSAAVDGRQGVTVFEKEGPFDVVLLDLSMPILDGIGATFEIRAIEARMKQESLTDTPRSRILALTGMSSLEDKRRAFEAGVDGYLVKPVAFKTLDEMFHKIGIS